MKTILTKTATAPGGGGSGLKTALIEFNLPANLADRYGAGVEAGNMLFFIRTPDERAAAVSDILREHQAENISGHAG
ncbi:MAG TPA: hypothetical protein VFZ76_07355 [Anaerolineales bacterium]